MTTQMTKQQRPKLMTTSKYQRYLKLQLGVYGEHKEYWQPNLKYVPQINPGNMRDWHSYREYKMNLIYDKYNNKEVLSNAAVWIGDVLLRGYILKNTTILRPIFQVKREEISLANRKNICLFAKMFATQSRHTLYNKALLTYTKLPQDVIDIITQMSWDILLLLR